jgi:hypothetical protein
MFTGEQYVKKARGVKLQDYEGPARIPELAKVSLAAHRNGD